MWQGCVVFLLVFAIAFVVELWWLPDAADPYRWQFSAILSFLVTLVVSNIWGLFHAFGRLRLAKKDPARWRDSEMVAISGELRPIRQALKAPVSGREVVVYEFDIMRVIRSSGKNSSTSEVSELKSLSMAPCSIYTQSGIVRITGFPALNGFKRQEFKGDTEQFRAASYIANNRWTRKPGTLSGALEQMRTKLFSPDASTEERYINPRCDLPVDVVEEDATANSLPPLSKSPEEVQRLAQVLQERGMRLVETVIEAGSVVTVFGVYRRDILAVDLTSKMFDVDRAIFPGPARSVVGRLITKASIVLIFMTVLAVGAHWAASRNEGEWLRRIAEASSQSD